MIGQTVSHYKIVQKIGEGGMGVVYKAQDLQLDRFVALKFLPADLMNDPAAKERFVLEAKAISSLQHTNVCTIHEIAEARDGAMFICMDYYDGQTLREKMSKSLLSMEEVVEIALQAARGLMKAHERGVIHRDIKPENLILTNDRELKILDFGLAEIRGNSRIGQSGVTLGTVSYMSPEQARGEKLDERTDIWSLGVVLYEALTGRHPFPGHYAAAVLYLVLHEQPQSMGNVRKDIPVKLEEIVRKCLQKNRDGRYAAVSGLFDELVILRKTLQGGIADSPPAETGTSQSQKKKFEVERRPVTVLFAALTHLDRHGKGADPEGLLLGMTQCLNGLVSIIRRYDGMTDRIVGQNLMAIFGAPIAHENDPERAIRSAQEMMSYVDRYNSLAPDGIQTTFQLHIGIHSGIVIAGSASADRGGDYQVIGDSVNIAAGIAEMTPADQIILSHDTYRLVSALVEVDAPRSMEIKGKTGEIQSFRLRSVRTVSQERARETGEKTFVGREKEKSLFDEALRRVHQREEVRISLRGEAGVGKTRLKMELVSRAQGEGVLVCEGKCSSFEISTPYYLWNTFLKDLLHVGTETPEAEIRSRLQGTLQILSLEAEEPYLAALLSLRYEEILLEVDEERKHRIYAAMKKLLMAYAARRPILVILEDLHWIDRFSQDLLEFVLSDEHIAQAIIFCIFRPEYARAERISSRTVSIDLDRLPRDEAQALALSRLGVSAIPRQLDDLIHQRAEGNPFFIEEIIKTLIDKRIIRKKKGAIELLSSKPDTGIPETLQGVIMARIDQLEGKIREVLLDASVIGRDFSLRVLENMIQHKRDVLSGLEKLRSLELILKNDEAREFEYLFKHYLIQEVAYNTILNDKRKKLHGLIAEVIEKIYAERLKEFYELLAFHYEKAENWSKAAEYLSRSGQKAIEIFSREESKDFIHRKEEAIAKLYESPGERRIGWIIAATLTALIATPLALAMLMVPYWIGYMYWHLPPHLEFDLWNSELLGNIAFVLYLALLFVGYPWAGLVFTFLGIVPAFKSRPQLFDILDDRIRIVFRNARVLSIHFSEIEQFRFHDPKVKRTWTYRLLDPLNRIDRRKDLGLRIWLKEVVGNVLPPFSFGFSSRAGQIFVSRRAGRKQLRLLFPWLHTFAKSREISLTPSDPRGFSEQLETAFTKWKSRSR